MVQPDEPGTPFVLEARIVDAVSGNPIGNAVIEFVHADRHGKYFREEGLWNPRLFGYLRSDSGGRVRVVSIRPGSYDDDDGNSVPSHFHFSVTAEGYQQRNGEIVLGDDSIIDKATREAIDAEGGLLATIHHTDDTPTGSVDIPLYRIPSTE